MNCHILRTMVTRVCAVRHGETDWNKEQRIQGQIDIPLNETGHAQALAMAYNAAHHAFVAIYSSDLQRASKTAAALAQREQHEVRIRADLRERHYDTRQARRQPLPAGAETCSRNASSGPYQRTEPRREKRQAEQRHQPAAWRIDSCVPHDDPPDLARFGALRTTPPPSLVFVLGRAWK